MGAVTAAPRYDVGDVVAYRDRQDRVHSGKVRAVEASWRWAGGKAPLVLYTLFHPTYRNRTFYTTDERIFGLANLEEPS